MSTSKEGEQMRELINTVKKATETKVLVKHMEDSSQYDSKDYGWESWKAFRQDMWLLVRFQSAALRMWRCFRQIALLRTTIPRIIS